MSRTTADRFARFASDPGNRIGKLAGLLRAGKKSAEVSGLRGGAAFFVASVVRENLQNRLLYIAASSENCKRAGAAIGSFTGKRPPVFDAEEEGLSLLAEAQSAPIVCATVDAVSRKTVSPDFLAENSVLVKTGDEIDRDELICRLEEAGYRKKDFARLPCETSVRGAVADVVRTGAEPPLRIEFSGDRIRSLRLFDPATQISVRRVDRARIFPARICAGADKVSSCIVDYCGKNPVVFIETQKAENIGECLQNAERERENLRGESKHFAAGLAEKKLSGLQTVVIQNLGGGGINFETSPVKPGTDGTAPSAGKIVNAAKSLISGGYRVELFAGSETEAEKMREIFREQSAERTRFHPGTAGGGFVFPDIGTAFVDEADFAEKIPAAPGPAQLPAGVEKFSASAFGDIKEGDFIVHREFGIGIFRGLKNLTILGTKGDFIECEYHGGDSVYVPVSKFRLLHRYIGNDAGPPKTDRLGGTAWKKTVHGAKRAAETVAREILELYANRKSGGGHSFSKPGAEFREFEMDFMFEETPDQKKAIREVMKDMESPRPMDRLICGDTGFGKTEVALRAALKAAMDGFQVAFIAPTTLLAAQHLATARKRFEKFPVNAVSLSRFNSASGEKAVIGEIERGTADIVIGTHKLLGKKVKFRNLGLLIIDEEHRFGVRDKEKLKTLKENLDVLSLSATPIPRTLQLSLAGIRDISRIDSPPRGRLPVEISIKKWDEELIRKLILRETEREGGVFFVHNRIETIDPVARRLKNLAPGKSIATAHGKTGKKDLENRIEKFARGETDILVTTAIVESGLDIPGANTIIVNDAHTFGIADLYQLKGRVGRGAKQAYACFLVPAEKSLRSEAWKRLERFSELRDFGSGYELAFSDLQMRGVGNLFGLEQSGHIAGVGIEFYLEMLRETVERLKTGGKQKETETEIRTAVESCIPENYIKNGGERLVFYRRISSSSTIREINGIKGEIRDRFGPVPDKLKNLLVFAALKSVLKKHSVALFEMEGDRAAAYREKGRSEPSMLFSGNGKNWTGRTCGVFPAKVADRVARLISSLKPVQSVE